VNIGNNSSVSEVDECIVYKSTIDRAWVKDGEVGVFNARGVEVRMRKGASMQSHAVNRVSLLATSLDRHSISNRDVSDILSYLGLPLLVAEEQLVVRRVSAIVEHPVVARMISIFLCLRTGIHDAKLRRGANKKHRCFVCRAFTVGVNEVDKGWYPS
jgi:hypothetical protein